MVKDDEMKTNKVVILFFMYQLSLCIATFPKMKGCRRVNSPVTVNCFRLGVPFRAI